MSLHTSSSGPLTSRGAATRTRCRPPVAAVVVALSAWSCGGSEPRPMEPVPTPASVELSTDTVRLASLGETHALSAVVRDENGAALTWGRITWQTSSPAVATVSADGEVTAVRNGATHVTAQAGEAVGRAEVVVAQVATALVTALDTVRFAQRNDTATVWADLVDALGSPLSGEVFEFTSGDESVVTIAGGGRARATGAGTTTVGISSEGHSGEVQVVVPAVEGRIAFSRSFGDPFTLPHDQEIFLMDADGTNLVQVTYSGRTSVRQPTWSPDGDRLAFVRSGIYLIGIDGLNETFLTEGSAPDWSPDGATIVYQHVEVGVGGGIRVIDVDGQNPVQLTDGGGGDQNPVWSPDGSRIAYQANAGDVGPDIFVMNADGSDPVNVTNREGYDGEPAWSPDGTRLAFVSDRRIGGLATRESIYVVNVDGTGLSLLTDTDVVDRAPAWSHDGTRITFSSRRDDYFEVFVMNADGTDVVNVTDDWLTEIDAVWRR